MIKTLGIAVVNRGDLLERCLESVDHPVETLFVVENGNDSSVKKAVHRIKEREISSAGNFGRIVVESYPSNLGCGPSWNRIIKNSSGPWLIIGSDVQLKPGSLAKVAQVEASTPDAHMICASGYNVFVLTLAGLGKVGLFDENFYPAYHEDCDHWRRLVLCGGKAVNVPGFEHVHGEAPLWGSCSINSDPVLQEFMGKQLPKLQDYYRRKWGGLPGQETLSTPFGKPVPLDYWTK